MSSPFDYLQAQATCNEQIARFAAGATVTLVRGVTSYEVICSKHNYKPREQDGQKVQLNDQKLLLSQSSVAEHSLGKPSMETDHIVFNGEKFRITAPPGKIDVQGTVLYWVINGRPRD